MRASRTVRTLLAVVLALAAGCSGGGSSAPAFAQADLAGRWRYTILWAGPAVEAGGIGWARGIVSVDAAGSSTLETYADSSGGTTLPALPSIVYAIDGAGVVTATTTLFAGAYGKMNPRKTIFAFTATQGTGAAARMRLAFYQRIVAGTSYGAADLASSTFALRQLASGSSPTWMRARVAVGADGVYSLLGVTDPSGPLGDVPDQGTLAMSSDGTVSTSVDPSFAGFMSSDKQLVVGTQTEGTDHRLSVLARAAGSFGQADLAGTWHYLNLAVTVGGAAWAHGTISFDAAGVATFGPQVDSAGGTETPSSVTLAVAADGTVTQTSPLPSVFNGALAPGKDVLVATETHAEGVYGLIVAIR